MNYAFKVTLMNFKEKFMLNYKLNCESESLARLFIFEVELKLPFFCTRKSYELNFIGYEVKKRKKKKKKKKNI